MGNAYLEQLYTASGVLSSVIWVSNQLKVWTKSGSFGTFCESAIDMIKSP